MSDVPESAAAVAHRMQAWQGGHLSGVDSAVILGAVRDAVNEASASLRAVREYCDYLDRAVARCVERNGDYPCTPCIERARIAKDIRALLPDIREAAGEVDVSDDRDA